MVPTAPNRANGSPWCSAERTPTSPIWRNVPAPAGVPVPAGEPLIHVDVALPGRPHDLVRNLRTGRCPVPVGRRTPVTNELFVEGMLRPSRLPFVRGPETRRVRSQHFVTECQRVTVPAEFHLRVRHENSVRRGVLGTLAVNSQRELPP